MILVSMQIMELYKSINYKELQLLLINQYWMRLQERLFECEIQVGFALEDGCLNGQRLGDHKRFAGCRNS